MPSGASFSWLHPVSGSRISGRTLLAFEPNPRWGKAVDGLVLSGTRSIAIGTAGSCYQEPKQGITHGNKKPIPPP